MKCYLKLFVQIFSVILLLLLASCATVRSEQDSTPQDKVDVSKIPDAVPKVEALSKYGNSPYVALGKRHYVLKSSKGYNKVGLASWYGKKFHQHLTSTRERYDVWGMTAASKDLPLPTYVQVTNLRNGKSVIVKVNDRGPFVGNRLIDLSYAAAEKLGYANKGTALVRVTAIDPHLWAQNKDRTQIAPAAVKSYAENKVYLQVGAFSRRDNAENFRQKVAALTQVPVYIKPVYHHHTKLYHVQVGPVIASESNSLRQKLEQEGIKI